jgi:hypothetical protein
MRSEIVIVVLEREPRRGSGSLPMTAEEHVNFSSRKRQPLWSVSNWDPSTALSCVHQGQQSSHMVPAGPMVKLQPNPQSLERGTLSTPSISQKVEI